MAFDVCCEGFLFEFIAGQKCEVPENAQTPTIEGISLWTLHTSWIFHFCRELMPHPPPPPPPTHTHTHIHTPLQSFLKYDKDPSTRLEKFFFTKKKKKKGIKTIK